MAEQYTKKDGRLVNSKGEWVWNGESYEYVINHSSWLPLVFKSKSDADEFELLEKIWKAEQIIKTSKDPQEVQRAKQWIKAHSAKHSDNYTNYLVHYASGKAVLNHKYIRREPLRNGKYRYIYNDNKSMTKSSSGSTEDSTSSQEKSNDKSEEYRNGRYFYNYNDKTGKISMDKDAKKRLRELKRDARKAEKEVKSLEKDKKLHNPTKYVINGEDYYKTKEGHLLRAGKYGEYVRSQEQEANKKSAQAYANYSRQIKLAEMEKAELKKYRSECQKAARKEFVDSVADKGMSIVNKLFKKS